ncbi:MAG: hypothetical protein L6Q84_08975 [Polyangiaceae bacterium]|nr:hypothetical protein [Polyangiaceae bacterium]
MKQALERVRAACSDTTLWRDLAPLIIALTCAPWIFLGWANYSQAPLFRDPAMYVYAAWCLAKGERIYDTIATPDGPLIYLISYVLLVFGMAEQAIRRADLWFHLIGGLVTGALLAPIDRALARWRRVVTASVWSVTYASVWLVFILHFEIGNSVQREQYYSLLGMGAVVLAYRSVSATSARAEATMLIGAGLLSALQLFGKHTGLIYVLLVGLVVVLAPRGSRALRWRARQVALGAAIAIGLMLAFIAAFGSLRGFVFWYFRYAFTVYRHWFPVELWGLVSRRSHVEYPSLAALTLAAGGTALAVRLLPRHALPFVLAPTAHYLLALLQRKGWQYHFIPTIASTFLLYMVALREVWKSTSEARDWTPVRAFGAVLLMAYVESRIFWFAQNGPWLEATEHFKHPEVEDTRHAADLLRTSTKPTDRVFFYGRDAIMLYLARRLPAAPHEVAWMLNFEPALRSPTTPEQRKRIEAFGKRVHGDLCVRLRQRPPEALLIQDGTDETGPDGLAKLTEFCPEFGGTVPARYHQLHTLGGIRIFTAKGAEAR